MRVYKGDDENAFLWKLARGTKLGHLPKVVSFFRIVEDGRKGRIGTPKEP